MYDFKHNMVIFAKYYNIIKWANIISFFKLHPYNIIKDIFN